MWRRRVIALTIRILNEFEMFKINFKYEGY